MCTEAHVYLASVRGDNEKGLDGMFAEEGMSLVPIARLHLVISIQTFKSGSGDMNLTEEEKQNNFCKYITLQSNRVYVHVLQFLSKFVSFLLII